MSTLYRKSLFSQAINAPRYLDSLSSRGHPTYDPVERMSASYPTNDVWDITQVSTPIVGSISPSGSHDWSVKRSSKLLFPTDPTPRTNILMLTESLFCVFVRGRIL